jgi:hypothetical protein
LIHCFAAALIFAMPLTLMPRCQPPRY